jgi:hypothetical protein
VELDCKDSVAREKCIGKKEAIVAAVQRLLGLAAVVSVSDVPGKGLKLETGSGSIIVDYNLENVVKDEEA